MSDPQSTTGAAPAISLDRLAKPSCRHCHGTGVYGQLLLADGRRQPIVCECVKRRAAALQRGLEEFKRQRAAAEHARGPRDDRAEDQEQEQGATAPAATDEGRST